MALIQAMASESQMTASGVLAALKGFSLEELDRVVATAERERQAKRDAARKALVEEVRAKAEALGLTLSTLLADAEGEGPATKGKRAPVLPKYRNPETGETWSGRGSAPGWLKRHEEQGRRREEFAVGNGS